MSECIIGIERCGCITYANARPDDLDKHDERAIARIVRAGGQIERLDAEEARTRPNFLAVACPHDPKGWEPDKPTVPQRFRFKGIPSRGIQRVSVTVPGWEKGFGAGEVRKGEDGKWLATAGWFNYRADGANNGDGNGTPADVFGPFDTKVAAAEALVPIAEARAAKLRADIARTREPQAVASGRD